MDTMGSPVSRQRRRRSLLQASEEYWEKGKASSAITSS